MVLKEPTKYIIYRILNIVTRKYYIGRTCSKFGLLRRWGVHLAHAKHGEKYLKNGKPIKPTYLCQSMRKYGLENFEIKIIDYASNFNHMVWLEAYYIKYYNTIDSKYGYNLIIDTYGDGREFTSEESIEKIQNSSHQLKRKSKFNLRGVSFANYDKKHNTNPWQMKFKFSGKEFTKKFPTKELAAESYDKLALYYYQEKSVLNFPEKLDEYKKINLEAFAIDIQRVHKKYSNYKFVYYDINQEMYSAKIKNIDKKWIHLGFYSEIEAAKIADKVNYYLFKDSNMLNFQEEVDSYDMNAIEKFYLFAINKIKQFNRETSSVYRGVSKHTKDHGFCWEVRCNKKRHRGFSTSELEAAQAYDRKAIELLGDKAKTNFPIFNYIN